MKVDDENTLDKGKKDLLLNMQEESNGKWEDVVIKSVLWSIWRFLVKLAYMRSDALNLNIQDSNHEARSWVLILISKEIINSQLDLPQV